MHRDRALILVLASGLASGLALVPSAAPLAQTQGPAMAPPPGAADGAGSGMTMPEPDQQRREEEERANQRGAPPQQRARGGQINRGIGSRVGRQVLARPQLPRGAAPRPAVTVPAGPRPTSPRPASPGATGPRPTTPSPAAPSPAPASGGAGRQPQITPAPAGQRPAPVAPAAGGQGPRPSTSVGPTPIPGPGGPAPGGPAPGGSGQGGRAPGGPAPGGPAPGGPAPGGPAPGGPAPGAPDLDQEGARPQQGVAGGDGAPSPLALWTDGSWSFLGSDRTDEPFRGDQQALLLGIDGQPLPGLVAGAVLALDNTELALKSDDGRLSALGASAILYAGYALHERVTIDARIGYGIAENEIERNTLGVETEGDFWSRRVSAGVNTAFLLSEDRFLMVANLGFSWSWEGFGDYRTSDGVAVDAAPSRLGTASLSGQAAYAFDSVTPFVEVGFDWDAVTTDETGDRTGLILGTGFSWTASERLALGAQVLTQKMRDDESLTTLGINARWQF